MSVQFSQEEPGNEGISGGTVCVCCATVCCLFAVDRGRYCKAACSDLAARDGASMALQTVRPAGNLGLLITD